MVRAGYFVLVLLAVAGGVVLWLVLSPSGSRPGPEVTGQNGSGTMTQAKSPDICEETVFEGARAILCVADPEVHDIRVVYRGKESEPYASVPKAVVALAAAGETPVLAMNAGMYHADMMPVGLYVENGTEFSPLNHDDGFGNFFLKPNGVFFIDKDNSAGVMETETYASAGISSMFATQSGPMLVINGAIHPRFLPDGTTKYIRNGIGVRADGKVVLAITRDPVSLGSFARLFRDVAECPDALFFDGGVSSLAWGTDMEIDSGDPAGPIVAVFGKTDG